MHPTVHPPYPGLSPFALPTSHCSYGEFVTPSPQKGPHLHFVVHPLYRLSSFGPGHLWGTGTDPSPQSQSSPADTIPSPQRGAQSEILVPGPLRVSL